MPMIVPARNILVCLLFQETRQVLFLLAVWISSTYARSSTICSPRSQSAFLILSNYHYTHSRYGIE